MQWLKQSLLLGIYKLHGNDIDMFSHTSHIDSYLTAAWPPNLNNEKVPNNSANFIQLNIIMSHIAETTECARLQAEIS
jgi:hypothetical protein